MKFSAIATLIFVGNTFGLTAATAAAAPIEGSGRICQKPASPLYATQDLHKPLQIQMIVDYKGLNASSGKRYRGVISVITENGQRQILPVLLSSRGNSRRSYCKAVPLRMEFLDPAIELKIENRLAIEKIRTGNDAYLKRYLELLENEDTDLQVSLKSQTGNIFENLGDDVKIVTHCGTASWDHVGGPDYESQNEKLLSEFYIYQLLAPLNTAVENVRLASIEYLNEDGSRVYQEKNARGRVVTSRLAFFREPPTSVAKRCGLLRKIESGSSKGGDSTSDLQAKFINYFVINNDFSVDGHNMNRFFDHENKTHYGPYDFDLSGIFETTYSKNRSALEENYREFESFLNSAEKEQTIPFAKRVLSSRGQMLDILDRAQLSPKRKAAFQAWLKMYSAGLKKYVQEHDK